MIKQMRRRFILAAMAAFFAVILMIAVLVNIFNYISTTDRLDKTLEAVLRFEEGSDTRPFDPGRPPQERFMGLEDVEANYMTRFFTVSFDENGDVIFASTDHIAAIDREEEVRYAGEVLKKNRKRGYMEAYRYAVDERDGTTTVSFLNAVREQQFMRSLLLLTLIVSFISLAVTYVLVWFLSKRAMRPFESNIRQQKQFITDAGHELKTPLTSISTSVDVIRMEHGDDEWTDNIKKQTARMSTLVGELVTLSRLDEDMPLPLKEQFSLSDAARETVEVYEPEIRACGKKLTVELEENVLIFGDREAIRKMFSVLLDNAVRYSDENGEIRVNVRKKKNRAVAEVFNTCDYEKPPDVERLFDRFYRPDESRSTKTGGNGVGLSIARAVVTAHGGKISAICPSGKTMTIRISF